MQKDESEYERVSEARREARRTIADAIEELRKAAHFNDDDCAKIHVGLLQLPSGQLVGLVDVVFNAPWEQKSYGVSLPTASRFKGLRRGSAQYDDFDIVRLNKAHADAAGTVILADETSLQAVEVIPARLSLDPSVLDWKIVHAALSVIEGGEHCYRRLGESLPLALQESVPEQRFLDCGRLSQLKLPPLKVIAIDIAARDPELKVSQQKIADALRKFGIRVPLPRPRVHARREGAKIRLG